MWSLCVELWRRSRATRVVPLVAVMLLVDARQVSAQGYDLSWYTMDGGGFTFSEGGGYDLGATIGQLDASTLMIGDNYELRGGFWPGLAPCPGDCDR